MHSLGKKGAKMRKIIIAMFFMFMTLTVNLNALLTVSEFGGFTPYMYIQDAIDDATINDTILVYPGTYYGNLNLDTARNLYIISLEAIENDTTYISQTIINGSRDIGSVIKTSHNLAQCRIQGFTITGGSYSNNPDIEVFAGGGLFVDKGHVSLKNSVVEYNHAHYGGGVSISVQGSLFLSGTTIRNNIAFFRGGGINIMTTPSENDGSNIIFDSENRCSIYDNFSTIGTDIYSSHNEEQNCEIYLDKFTVVNPSRYYIDYAYPVQSDNPMDGLQSPYSLIDIQEGVHQLIDADLYVSNQGSDSNSGLTPNEALRSMCKAFQLITSNPDTPRTVYLAPGEYQSIAHGVENVPIYLKSYTSIEGVSTRETSIIFEGKMEYGRVGIINSSSRNTEDIAIRNLTLTNTHGSVISSMETSNVYLENLIIKNSYGVSDPVLYLKSSGDDSNVVMNNIIIKNNSSNGLTYTVGEIAANNITMEDITIDNNHNDFDFDCYFGIIEIRPRDKLVIKNLEFINNRCQSLHCDHEMRIMDYSNGPGADVVIDNMLYANNSMRGQYASNLVVLSENVFINNSTIANNFSAYTDHTITVGSAEGAKISNSIIANNAELYAINTNSTLWLDYNLISNQVGYIFNGINNSVTIGNNNLFAIDPLFIGGDPTDASYYHLSYRHENDHSPAVDSGSGNFDFLPEWYDLSDYDLDGNQRISGGRVDLGCFEHQFPSENNDTDFIYNSDLTTVSYPNPFNPETTIEFNNPLQGQVSVNIYNLKGQLVKSLLEDNLKQGLHKVIWRGKDSNGKQVSSGIYFYKISNGNNKSVTKKIILMK